MAAPEIISSHTFILSFHFIDIHARIKNSFVLLLAREKVSKKKMSRENKPRDDVTKTRENFTTDNDSEDVKSNLLNDYNNYGNGDKKNDDVIKKNFN